MVLGLATPLPWAQAVEGPGYGGTGDSLSVAWVAPEDTAADEAPADQPAESPADQPAEAPTEQPAPAPEPPSEPAPVIELGGGPGSSVIVSTATQPTLEPDRLQLQVNGLGFRAKSTVMIRVGDAAPVTARSDTAGSLDIAIDPALLGGAQPGLSVVAIGRAPSGTAVTLYGSVPPEPSGVGPMTLIPWLALTVALASLTVWLRRRRHHTRPHDSSASGTADWDGAAASA